MPPRLESVGIDARRKLNAVRNVILPSSIVSLRRGIISRASDTLAVEIDCLQLASCSLIRLTRNASVAERRAAKWSPGPDRDEQSTGIGWNWLDEELP